MSRGRFYIRLEHEEWDFLGKLPERIPFDGAIIAAPYLTMYPEGHPRHGQPSRRLVDAVEHLGVDWLLDPESDELSHTYAAKGELRPRALTSPLAAPPFELPIAIEAFRDRELVRAWAEAGLELQAGSRLAAAPYLEVSGLDDPALDVACALVEATAELAGDRVVVGFLQVLRRQLLDGTAAEVARRLTDAGARRVLIRIRRFDAEEASIEELLAYARLIEAVGTAAVPDCVGRLGPALVASGADGFSAGAHRFRKVRDDRARKRSKPAADGGGGGGGPPLGIEVPGEFRSVSRDTDLRALPACPDAACPLWGGDHDEVAVRIHDLHELHALARLAAHEGLAFADRLRRSPSQRAQTWALALDQLARARRAA